MIDAAPYFGHPEADLALVGYFEPVPDDVLAAYQEILPVDPGFAARRELWRLPAYLAVVAVAAAPPSAGPTWTASPPPSSSTASRPAPGR